MTMDELIEGFTGQLSEALEIGRNAELNAPEREVNNVLVTGLGGSGIGGKIVSQLVQGEANVPILLNNDYHLPEFVGRDTLVIVSSYSGNTEETVNAMEEAMVKDAQVVCISSNGKVQEIAREKGYDMIRIPGGYPPRAALAYSLVQQFFILSHFGVIPSTFDFVKEIQAGAKLLDMDAEPIRDKAKKYADELHGKLPVIYTEAKYEGVGIRFRQQLNENAKTLCWHHALPEMNHNELVGWGGGWEDIAVILFRNQDDQERTQTRFEITKGVIGEYTDHIHEIWSHGDTRIQRSLYLIHVGDWISYYLAEKKGVDPVEVSVIDHLKGELAKV